jgi:isocitrate dehydrogenase (NAD+)
MLSLSQAPVKWEPVDVTPILKDGKTAIPDEAIKSVQKNFVALKGPLAVRSLSITRFIAATRQY